MKTLLLVLAALLLAPAARAQTTAPAPGQEAAVPFRKATVIILHTTDSAAVAYVKVARLLLAAGYTIEKSDKELGYISTGYARMANTIAGATLHVQVLPAPGGAAVEFRGGVSLMSSGRASNAAPDAPIAYGNLFGTGGGFPWERMAQVANDYHAPRLSYR